MSSRPASPPPIARWPFYAGAGVLAIIAAVALITSGRPPSEVGLVVALACVGGGIVLGVAPTILAYEQRLRLAEAAVRDSADAQLRRLAQTADQLAHVVSRGQSTEEQAGQALGTLEEVAERLVAQAEELATALTRSGEREQTAHTEEIQRLTEERDQKLTALEIRLNAMSLALTETQAAIKKSSIATQRAVETVAARLDSIVDELRGMLSARPVAPAPAVVSATTPVVDKDEPPVAPVATPEAAAPEVTSGPPTAVESPVAEAISEPAAANESAEPSIVADTAVAAVRPVEDSHAHRPSRRPRNHHPVESVRSAPETEPVTQAASEPTAPPAGEPASRPPVDSDVAVDREAESSPSRPTAPLELALEGMPEPRPVMRLNRRDPPGSTSLVATAYIGIGNKLFLRGDGPGLSWERGVPMQFLAIGKWGWTTTDAAVPVTCRVYRNDDTPMLEENIVIDPGTKTEITPRF